MKKLAFAVALQIAILTISVAAQTPNIPRTASAFAVRPNSAPSAVAGSNSATSAGANATLTNLYRVGISDVLDIQLPGTPTTQSTLFTVLPEGVIEYPLAGEPLRVAGLTTSEIANQLKLRIKVLDRPAVNVSVRDYASHTVTVVGFVSAPGTKILRREAVPLYVLLAEAQPLNEATRATIFKSGQAEISIDLKDSAETGTLIGPGDSIKVLSSSASVSEYFYAGGALNSAGQKLFHRGLTLTQAILQSGGLRNDAGATVRVSRQATDGRLTSLEYNINDIQNGKAPDPILQKDDRIQVSTLR